MNEREVRTVISKVTYKPGWTINVDSMPDDLMELWLRVEAPDAMTGELSFFDGRSWVFNPHASTEDDLVGLCLLAIKTFEEHEMLEILKYDGMSIYNPHLTLASRQEAYCRTFPLEKSILAEQRKK